MSADPLAPLTPTPFPEMPQTLHIDPVEAAEECDASDTKIVDERPDFLSRVVECYGCDEFAFDGTFTAYMTDEGEQPFCMDCVDGIRRRSEPRAYGAPTTSGAAYLSSNTWSPGSNILNSPRVVLQ